VRENNVKNSLIYTIAQHTSIYTRYTTIYHRRVILRTRSTSLSVN